ncbi:MAG: S1 RNA-binding domain-containing protein [Lachnospiraceae bacterium]|nr:S1 RNA-binding domain-containing protein [Lachnospiraceae bacterium]
MAESMKDYEAQIDNSFRKINEGDILTGTVIGVSETDVTVDIGYYTQGVIPAAEYSSDPRFSVRHDVEVGTQVEATVVKTDDGHGNILLSRKKATDELVWDRFKKYMDEKTEFEVKIDSAVKSGVVAFLEDTRGFIPASKLSLSFVEESALAGYVGKTIRVRVADVDKDKKKLILSAREILREEADKRRAAKASNVRVGLVTEGTVESLKDYGAFVDLGEGLSGLLHISEITSEKRLKFPGEVLKVGDKIKVKVTKIKDGKLSLSMKALEEIPAEEVSEELAEYKSDGEATTSLADLLKKAGF